MKLNIPNEIWNRIFKTLSYKDLKTVLLVCKQFKVIAEDPQLWSQYPLIICSNLSSTLSLPRLSLLSQLDLVDIPLSDSDLVSLQQTRLTCLCLDKCDLSALSAQLLATCLAGLTTFKLKVNFEYRQEERFSDDQICAIFEELSKSFKLQNLHLRLCDLSPVPPSTLAMVLSRLAMADLYWCLLSPGQVVTLFTRLQTQPARIRQLDIGYNNISMVPATTLAEVVCRMDMVNMYNFKHSLTRSQLGEMFKQMSNTEQLSELILGGTRLAGIPADTLAMAVTGLEIVNLDHCDLTKGQAVAVVAAAGRSDRLRGLYMSGNNLASIEPDILARCVTRLQLVSISLAQLTRLQTRHIVSRMVTSGSNSNLREFDISYNDLSQADPVTLATAVNSLERAVMHHTDISEYQTVKILKHVISGTKLKYLDIGGDLRTISPDIIAQSFNKLCSVTIHTETTDISKKAGLELFKQMGKESCLRKLDLQYRDLSRLPSEVIARAVNNLTEVNLMETNLSDDQILMIFARMSEKTSLRYLDIRGSDVRIVPDDIYRKAKQKCHFILHDFDRNLKNKNVKERFFGNKRD
eukprot:GFUD01040001.1.p1 GENE.GFUD01040001.1~~GFUD01040001.1.p1  ORF type:complete len:578 (+),score=190.16 GFUD01040001.1:47-1780(+)